MGRRHHDDDLQRSGERRRRWGDDASLWLWVVGVVGLPVVGLVAHVSLDRIHPWWLGAPLPLLVEVLGLGITWAVVQESSAARWAQVRLALTMGGGVTSVVVGALAGPCLPWVVLHVTLAPLVCLWWQVAEGPAVTGRRGGGAGSGLDDLVGLPGARVSGVARDGARITATIRTAGVQDAEDVQSAGRRLRALLGAATLRVVPHPSDPRRADVVAVHEDVLREPRPWRGPSAPGESIGEPIRLGVREDGSDLRLWLPGDGGRPPWLGGVCGMPGSGKTGFFRAIVGELMTRRDAVLWLVDTAKGAQTLGPVAPAVDWAAGSAQDAQAMLAAVERVSRARAEWLGSRGMDKWAADCGIPLLVVYVEEAARIADTFAERVIRLSELVRSTGVVVIFSMQRMSATNMPTDARANLTGGACFGVRDSVTASFVLSADTLDAGARPDQWRGSRPGTVILEAPGVPEDEWSMPGRVELVTDEDLAGVAHHFAGRMAVLDGASVAAAGPAYAARTVTRSAGPGPVPPVVPAPRAAGTAGTGTAPARTATAVLDPQDEIEDMMRAEDRDEARGMLDPERLADLTPEDLAAMAAVDLDADLPGIDPEDDVELGDPQAPGERLAPAEQAEAVRALLADLVGGSTAPVEVSTAALVERWLAVPGMPARPALYRWLARYEEAGLVADAGRGVWSVHPSAADEPLTVVPDEGDED